MTYLWLDYAIWGNPDWFTPINKDVWWIEINGNRYNWKEYEHFGLKLLQG